MINPEAIRENWKSRRLDLKSVPPLDLEDKKLASEKIRLVNIKLRLKDLSEVLEVLFNIYKKNKNLYGDKFLAFVGNEVIRQWPWKDFPFTSVKAQAKIKKKITGLNNIILDKETKKKIAGNITYEHWTPISFFRDIFDFETHLTSSDFYNILLKYYRIVRITKDENKSLDEKYKTTRPTIAYDELRIKIYEKELWDDIYKDII